MDDSAKMSGSGAPSISGHKSLIRAAAHMNDNVSLIGTQVANLRTQLDELNIGEWAL